jgi:hypothetical protein
MVLKPSRLPVDQRKKGHGSMKPKNTCRPVSNQAEQAALSQNHIQVRLQAVVRGEEAPRQGHDTLSEGSVQLVVEAAGAAAPARAPAASATAPAQPLRSGTRSVDLAHLRMRFASGIKVGFPTQQSAVRTAD